MTRLKGHLAEDAARALADLARSGITKADARRMGIEVLDSDETKRLTGATTASYRIPYLDINGRETEFYRVRLLDPPVSFKGKLQRYWQPIGTLPRLYLPPFCRWSSIAKDVSQDVWITEGEKKATTASKAGAPCIALGGVWAFRSKKAGQALLPDFKQIEWRGRRVVLCFDSDVASKPEVQAAMVALSRELLRMGATAEVARIPADDAEKVGLDDYIVKYGAEALRALERDSAADELGLELRRLNDELAFVRRSHAAFHLPTGSLLNRKTVTQELYANRVVRAFEGERMVTIAVADEWYRWPHRREHEALTYAPGQPRITATGELNTWEGWGVEPIVCRSNKDVEPWLKLVEYLFRGDRAHQRWFLQWCAYPLVYPGTKMYVAVVFYSRGHGVGKSLAGMTLGRLYGKNFSKIGQKELHSDYNSWIAKKQFVLGDEITGSHRWLDADRLKDMVTSETTTVNAKYQPQYEIADCVNYMFTTNKPDAFVLEDDDRRYFVHEVIGAPLERAFYDAYDAWFKSPAVGALLWYLQNRVDLAGFNPRERAPATEAKRQMLELSRSDADSLALAIAEGGAAAVAAVGEAAHRELWTLRELLALADPNGRSKLTEATLARALSRAGFKQVGGTTRTAHGPRRLWALRNLERWAKANHNERANQYDEERRVSERKSKC